MLQKLHEYFGPKRQNETRTRSSKVQDVSGGVTCARLCGASSERSHSEQLLVVRRVSCREALRGAASAAGPGSAPPLQLRVGPHDSRPAPDIIPMGSANGKQAH